jgi:hypothetical protein
MPMRYFIYFRNPEYAKILAEQFPNSSLKNTVSELLGTQYQNEDIYIIDVHQGLSDMSDLHGLQDAFILLNSIERANVNAKIWLLSWFTKEYLIQNNPFAKELSSSNKIKFYQMPLMNNNYERK